MPNRLDFYHQHYQATYAPTIAMSRQGIRCNRRRLQARFDELNTTLDTLRAKLRQQAGEDIFGKKGSLSSKKAQKFFFETLGCTPVWRKKKGKDPVKSVDENAVRIIKRRNKKRPEVVQACDDILLFRFADARKKFCKPEVVDPDGRIRASYYFNTLTLRFGSKKNPMESGHNLQNCPRGERAHFLADKGHVLLKRDLSQAESRIVYMLTGADDLVWRARSAPTEYDDHIDVAMGLMTILYREGLIDSPRYEDLSLEQKKLLRFFGKTVNHASNYGITGVLLSMGLLELGYVVAPDICQEMIDAKMEARPEIKDVFQRGLRRLITTDKLLVNPFGHRLGFTYVRKDQRAFRQAYMFIPQSTVPMIMNTWGMVPLHREIRRRGWDAHTRNQVHDELLVSAHPEDAWEVASFLGTSLARPVGYPDLTIHRTVREMTIPSTLSVGRNWQDTHEWKAEPTRKQFEKVLDSILSGRKLAA